MAIQRLAVAVPDLTRIAGIQLNERVSLRRRAKAVTGSAPDIPRGGLCSSDEKPMIASSDNSTAVRLGPSASLDADLALVDGLPATSIHHRPARLRTSLAPT
jgi:hypothetical protein